MKQPEKLAEKREHNGDEYYRHRIVEEESRAEESQSEEGQAKKETLKRGSEDMGDKSIDPLHFLIDFDSIYQHILEAQSTVKSRSFLSRFSMNHLYSIRESSEEFQLPLRHVENSH